MEYLGGLRGTGHLVCGSAAVAPTQYDFDGYLSKGGQVTSCGEIRLPASMLKELFGRADLKLQTDDGRWLRLRFSEKRLPSNYDGAAHVDVAGDLPVAAEWRHPLARHARRPAGADWPPIPPLHPRAERG